jgi:archaemetzincin
MLEYVKGCPTRNGNTIFYILISNIFTTKNKSQSEFVESRLNRNWGFFRQKKDVIKVPDDTLPKPHQKEEAPEEALKRERVKRELELLRKEFEETQAILDTTSSRLDALKNEYYSKSSEMDSLDVELQRKRSEVRATKLEYNRVKSEFDRLNSELSQIRLEYNPRILESTRQEIEMARSELAKLTYQSDDKKILVDDLHSKIDFAKSELGDIKSRIESGRSELEMIKLQSESAKKETSGARRELEVIRRELTSPEQLDQTRKISQAAAVVVAQANQKSEELKKNIMILRESLLKALEENHKLEEKLAVPESVKKILDAKSELMSLQSQQEIKKKELDQTKKELKFLQKELASIYTARNMVPTAEERQEPAKLKLKILLQPVGPVSASLMKILQARLGQQFNSLSFELTPKVLSLPVNFIDLSRNQFKSSQVIDWVEKNCGGSGYDRILGICDADAYSGELNFVMGEAQLGGLVALVYLKMFRTELERSDAGEELFLQRVQKEAVHELGHIFGLEHCNKNICSMYFSNSLADTDFKNIKMCQSCTKKMLEKIS